MIIGAYCWVGANVFITEGVKIGENSVIGANSVVTKNIPPHCIAAGNPAKVLFTIGEYTQKVKNIRKGKKVFGVEYFIENLDEKKRTEIRETVRDSLGFIV